MSFSLRPLSVLIGMVLVAPLTAQTTVPKSTATAVVRTAHVRADTAVTWVALSNDDGKSGKLPQLLKAEIAKAKALGLTPFLELGAPWCGPCRELEAKLHDKDMIDAFAGAYMIHLNIDEWDIIDDLEPLGVPRKETIPLIFSLDKNGKLTSMLHNFKGEAAPIKEYLHPHLWNFK
jgi:thiol-disulfide isomerase/thioredoxin